MSIEASSNGRDRNLIGHEVSRSRLDEIYEADEELMALVELEKSISLERDRIRGEISVRQQHIREELAEKEATEQAHEQQVQEAVDLYEVNPDRLQTNGTWNI